MTELKACANCGKDVVSEDYYALRHYMKRSMYAVIFCSLKCLKEYIKGEW